MNGVRTRSWRSCLTALAILIIVTETCILATFSWSSLVEADKVYKEAEIEAQIAEKLGVEDITKYPYHPIITDFPAGYFAKKLHKGMPIATVHEIVQGYIAVYHCTGNRNRAIYPGDREVYDFYGTTQSYGITVELGRKIEIQYDDQGRFMWLRVDDPQHDPNSEPVDMTGCEPGRLGE